MRTSRTLHLPTGMTLVLGIAPPRRLPPPDAGAPTWPEDDGPCRPEDDRGADPAHDA